LETVSFRFYSPNIVQDADFNDKVKTKWDKVNSCRCYY